MNYMAQGLVVYTERSELVLHSATYRSIYRLCEGDLKKGLPIDEVIKLQARALGLDEAGIAEFATPFADSSIKSWSAVRRLPDGRSIHMLRRQMGNGFFVVTHEDITERVRMEDEIRYAASHDTLTGLANRYAFMEQLEAALRRVRRGDRIALLTVDLDGFKHINDTHGHAVGDDVLKQVARRLEATVRETDVTARFGGDEFGVIQVPAVEPLAATRLATRIVEELAAPYFINNLVLYLGASVGVACADENITDSSILMQNSDLALYRAKQDGRGCWRFYDDLFDQSLRRKTEMEQGMRAALADDHFVLHYQPIVNIDSGRVESVEALLRWPDNGAWISPGEFIPIAEECGLIIPLGDWAIREACHDAVQWPETMSIAVNVSPLQFKAGNLVQSIRTALAQSGLKAGRLKIEITESLLLDNTTDVVATLNAIRALGVRIALDDFGTGYSSLSYLAKLPFDTLKIDRAFVQDSVHSKGRTLIHAVITLAKGLEMNVVAEGVEREEEFEILKNEGCDLIQGYLTGKPLPASEVEKILRVDEAVPA